VLPDARFDPTVLKAVEEHASELRAGKVLLGDPLRADSGIVDTTKQVFRTLLRAELGLKAASFDQDEKEEALELRAKRTTLESDEGALDELVELFTELCDRWPEVLDLRYGGTRADFREFRAVFMPALLSTLQQLFREKGSGETTSEVQKISRDYDEAVRAAERSPAAAEHEWDEEE
jgi:hypothetical protein